MHKTWQNEYFNELSQLNECFANLTAVESTEGIVHADQKVINNTYHSFYSELYSSQVKHDDTDCTSFLNNVQLRHLPNPAASQLDAPISLAELKYRVQNLSIGKSPGYDGFTID